MIKQLFIPLILVAVFIAAVGIYVKRGSPAPSTPPSQNQKVVKIGAKDISVEIASTSDARAKGLSGRYSLGENNGMLFVFPLQNNTSSFWMKDMKIGLDIIWIDDGKVIDIDKDVPSPESNAPDSSLATYSAGAPFDYVLEVNAGFSDRNGIKVGDSVTLPTL